MLLRGISAQRIKKTGLGRREGRKRDIPALLLALDNEFLQTNLPVWVLLKRVNSHLNFKGYSTITSRITQEKIYKKYGNFGFSRTG